MSKTVNGETKKFGYDGQDLILEMTGTDSIVANYTFGFGIDRPLSMTRNASTYYYIKDVLGSVTALTDENGTIEQKYEYGVFGNVVSQVGSVENLFTYVGREYDKETGNYYYRARYYDPSTGRFLKPDPLGFWGMDENLYSYQHNNVTNFTDPYGLFRFGKRALKGLPWIPIASDNPLDDYFNTEISHEHGFFEDGSDQNVGYGPHGRFSEDPKNMNYHYQDKHYDDKTMQEALNSPEIQDIEGKGYNLLFNNCQKWVEALTKAYERIKAEKEQTTAAPCK